MNDTKKRSRGRPPTFDRSDAIDAAMTLFWDRGYERTSIADLVEAMGMNAPSIYHAFGDKSQLYRAALDRYKSTIASYSVEALNRPTGYAAIKAVLAGAAASFTATERPTGCLVVISAISTSGGAMPGLTTQDPACESLKERKAFRTVIFDRLRQARKAGEIGAHEDIGAFADFVIATYQGLALAARDGYSRRRLNAIVDRAMKAYPGRRE